MSDGGKCFCCGSSDIHGFYRADQIPLHSVLLMPSREAATRYPKRDLQLGFCNRCGFIQNVIFDASVHEYSTNCEESQGCSPQFNAFARTLAQELVDRHDLHGKTIVEIGCGKGEFLALLCELGGNSGVGIDPAYVPGRLSKAGTARIEFIQDFYSEKYDHLHGDMICCRHTLEHIQPTRQFLKLVRKSVEKQPKTVVFFEVPDVERVLQEHAFWDIYYEHCSYFSLGSLARLFRSCGLEITNLEKAFDDQYLLIECRLGDGSSGPIFSGEDDMGLMRKLVSDFEEQHRSTLRRWTDLVMKASKQGKRVVIWGAGSKGVAFLTTLGIGDQVRCAVDINPFKQGKFMPGTGHEVVAPEAMKEEKPDMVLVMNPIYCNEVGEDLRRMNVEAELIPVR